jgi:hypothetical protein
MIDDCPCTQLIFALESLLNKQNEQIKMPNLGEKLLHLSVASGAHF